MGSVGKRHEGANSIIDAICRPGESHTKKAPRGALLFALEFMQLPDIKPGKRFTLPRPFGSADALLLAQFALAQTALGKLTVIITAEPADTQRLEDELALFAPALRVAVFPDWETLPYDTFSPHQDLISERLATLWRLL